MEYVLASHAVLELSSHVVVFEGDDWPSGAARSC
jgi:hypothetical protein